MATDLAVLTLAEASRWDEAVRAIPGWDIYWLSGYARIWQENGDGRACLALLTDGDERIAQVFLRRPVSLGESPPRWDIATPYGYGGLLASPGAHRLLPSFHEQFAAWCRSAGVLSQFIRCHPLLSNHRLLAGSDSDVTWKGVTVWLDLQAGPPQESMKAEVRNRIRKAERAGMTTRFTPAPTDLTRFRELYHATMARREASPYYHFSDASFDTLQTGLTEHLLLGEALIDDQVAGAALFLYNGEYLHYHLGGSDPAWLHLAPNNKLFHDAACWGRERGIRQMHLGGGMRPGDSLLRFKSGFSPLRADFCVGTQIFDREAYREMTERHRQRHAAAALRPDFFPAYRAPVIETVMTGRGERP